MGASVQEAIKVYPGVRYMSIADRQLEPLLGNRTRVEFEKSLYFNVLFGEGLAIPDVFFFISDALTAHELTPAHKKLTFLESCVAQGLVRPCFRDPGLVSFRDALEVLRGQGDASRALAGLRPESDALASRLDGACQSHVPISIPWPPRVNVGARFGELLASAFSDQTWRDAASSGGGTPTDSAWWKMSEAWRTDCVAEAARHTREIAGQGLRRGELFKTVAKHLGYSGKEVIDDIGVILRLPQQEDQRAALTIYWKWVNAVYQFNQARRFGLEPNIAMVDSDVTCLVERLPELDGALAAATPVGEPTVIRFPLRVPSLKALGKVKPEKLLDVRNERSADYFGALATWQRRPDDAAAKGLAEAAEKYSRGLVEAGGRRDGLPEAVVEIVLGSNALPAQALALGLMAVATAGTVAVAPALAPLVSVGGPGVGLGFSMIRWLKGRGDRLDVEFHSRPGGPDHVEMNLGA